MSRWRGGGKAFREHSTAQDSALWKRDEIPPRLSSSMPDGKVKGENAATHSLPTSTLSPHNEFHNLDSHTATRSSPRSPWERHKRPQPVIATGKRKAGIATRPPPARRRKVDRESRNFNMEDEEHVRQIMDLPTKEQYPGLPKEIFDAPKLTLHNMVQGLMQLHSTFSQVQGQHFRCQASCTLEDKQRIEAMGDGKTKVCSLYCIFNDATSLTNSRNKPRKPPTYIY